MIAKQRRPLDDLQPERVCIVKVSALGDIVQALPVLAGLRARWPQVHVSWIIKKSLANLLENHPQIDQLIYIDDVTTRLRWTQVPAYWQYIRGCGPFDLTIDLQGLLRSGLMTLATGARHRVGFANAREGSTLAYTDRIGVPTMDVPAVERYWSVVRALGGAARPSAPTLQVCPNDAQWASERLASLPKPILAIHPGSTWDTKRLPTAHYIHLANAAWKKFGAGVVLFSGDGEEALCGEIQDGLDGNVVNLAGQTNLSQLSAASAHADVFLSGDTGPMHLAAAVGTQVVSMFTCTSPLRAGPYGSSHTVIATDVNCAGSYLRRCADRICVHDLTPFRVWPELRAALHQSAGERVLNAA